MRMGNVYITAGCAMVTMTVLEVMMKRIVQVFFNKPGSANFFLHGCVIMIYKKEREMYSMGATIVFYTSRAISELHGQ